MLQVLLFLHELEISLDMSSQSDNWCTYVSKAHTRGHDQMTTFREAVISFNLGLPVLSIKRIILLSVSCTSNMSSYPMIYKGLIRDQFRNWSAGCLSTEDSISLEEARMSDERPLRYRPMKSMTSFLYSVGFSA